MQKLLGRPRVRVWLALAGASTLVIGAAYTLVQQENRLSADDLPLSTAQTVRHELSNGVQPTDVVPAVQTDLRNDSTVFVVVTDNSQHILASSALLDNKTPLPPAGVFTYTTAHGTDHFTWQPQSGVRLATRVMTYSNSSSNGFIITGQSLKQAESRVSTFNSLAISAWLAMLAWTYIFLLLPIQSKLEPKKETKK